VAKAFAAMVNDNFSGVRRIAKLKAHWDRQFIEPIEAEAAATLGFLGLFFHWYVLAQCPSQAVAWRMCRKCERDRVQQVA
jgi:hypothetical protein